MLWAWGYVYAELLMYALFRANRWPEFLVVDMIRIIRMFSRPCVLSCKRTVWDLGSNRAVTTVSWLYCKTQRIVNKMSLKRNIYKTDRYISWRWSYSSSKHWRRSWRCTSSSEYRCHLAVWIYWSTLANHHLDKRWRWVSDNRPQASNEGLGYNRIYVSSPWGRR